MTVMVHDASPMDPLTLFLKPLRQEDVDEWTLGSGGRPLRHSLTELSSMIGTEPGHYRCTRDAAGWCSALWGVSQTKDPDVGMVWFIASKAETGRWREYHRVWPAELGIMHNLYPTLVAYPMTRNKLHTRWLEAVGFKLTGTLGYTQDGPPVFSQYMRSIT